MEKLVWDIKQFELLDGYRLRLTFETDETGIIDLEEFQHYGGVFERFKDMDYFRQVYLESGVLTWPDGVDIAPETIYSMATGKPLSDWATDPQKKM